MDGFALTRHVRGSQAEWRSVPIVALTANAMAGEAEKCLAAGMNDYLAKPVEMRQLRDCLERWLAACAVGSQGEAADSAHVPPASVATDDILDLKFFTDCVGADEKAIARNLEIFVESLDADVKALSAAIDRGDVHAAGLIAHRIKGAARFVGGSRVARSSEAVEEAAEIVDWAGIRRGWTDLAATSIELRDAIMRRAR